MKLTWKTKNKNNKRPLSSFSNLPFEQDDDDYDSTTTVNNHKQTKPSAAKQCPTTDGGRRNSPATTSPDGDIVQLAESFQEQGNKLAEDGKYHEALGRWETAITLMPDKANLHEQKAQVLLEIGEAWNALKAATRATELEPSWAEAWVTLGRAQLNFGEPDDAIKSFDRSLAIKPDCVEAQDDRQTALHLVKKRKQLQSSGLSDANNRYVVGDKTEHS